MPSPRQWSIAPLITPSRAASRCPIRTNYWSTRYLRVHQVDGWFKLLMIYQKASLLVFSYLLIDACQSSRYHLSTVLRPLLVRSKSVTSQTTSLNRNSCLCILAAARSKTSTMSEQLYPPQIAPGITLEADDASNRQTVTPVDVHQPRAMSLLVPPHLVCII